MLSGTVSGSASLFVSSKSEKGDMNVPNSERNTAEDAASERGEEVKRERQILMVLILLPDN